MNSRKAVFGILVIIGFLGSSFTPASGAADQVRTDRGSPPSDLQEFEDLHGPDSNRTVFSNDLLTWQTSTEDDQSVICDPDFQQLVDQVSGVMETRFTLPDRIVAHAYSGRLPADAPPNVMFMALPVVPAPGEDPICGPMSPAQPGRLQTCMIIFLPGGQDMFDRYALNAKRNLDIQAAPDLFRLLAHELYHCHQFHLVDDVTTFAAIPRWIAEGAAEWVGMQYLYGGAGVAAQGRHQTLIRYLQSLEWDLFGRDYDAIGFFAHLHLQVARSGTDEQAFWSALDSMILLPWGGTQDIEALNAEAFNMTADLGGEDFLALWAMGTIREQQWGENHDWWLIGPGLSDASRPPQPEHYVLIPDVPVEIAVDPRGIAHATIQMEGGAASVLKIDLDGYGGLHWNEDDRDERFEPSQSYEYCVDPMGCVCPDGSSPLGGEARQISSDDTVTLALTGGLEAGSARFQLRTLDDVCREAVAPVCGIAPQGTGPNTRRFSQTNGCDCDTLVPGSRVFSDDYDPVTGRIISCLISGMQLDIFTIVAFRGPDSRDDRADLLSVGLPGCSPVSLPESGAPGCLLVDGRSASLRVRISDDMVVDVNVSNGSGQGEMEQMAMQIADHLALGN
jgi:hypothetical protein